MDILKQLNNSIRYIEQHLCEDIDLDEAAKIACITKDSFLRFFSYMTGMTVNEYIRRRRLTLAAYDLQRTGSRVIDIAVKYQYESADAFTRAFSRQHGITPAQAKKYIGSLKVYSPASFHIMIKGAEKMDFQIIETEAVKLKGLSRCFSKDAAARFEQEHIMWAHYYDNVPRRICEVIPGIWYGVWDHGTYSIAKSEEEVDNNELQDIVVPAGTYAVFKSGLGGFAGDELPKLREAIFSSWLQDSDYAQAADYEVEVYHLHPRDERHKRQYELWIPITKK